MDPYQQQFVSDMQAMFDIILLWEKTSFNNNYFVEQVIWDVSICWNQNPHLMF